MVFDEAKFLFSAEYKHFIPPADTPLLQAWYRMSGPIEPSPIISENHVVPEEEIPRQSPTTTSVTQQIMDDSHQDNNTEDAINQAEVDENISPPQSPQEAVLQSNHPMVTRGKAGISKPNPRYVMLTVKGIPTEPRSVAEALAHEGWNGAMGEEIDTCEETNTWTLVPRPDGVHLLGCRWIYKVKLNDDGTVKCLRARIVAKGNE